MSNNKYGQIVMRHDRFENIARTDLVGILTLAVAERCPDPVQKPAEHAQSTKFNPVLCMHISSAIAHHRLPTFEAGKRNESLPGCKDEREMPEIPNSQGASENYKIGDRTYSVEAFSPKKPDNVRAHPFQAGAFLMAGHHVIFHRHAPWSIGRSSATAPEQRY